MTAGSLLAGWLLQLLFPEAYTSSTVFHAHAMSDEPLAEPPPTGLSPVHTCKP